MKKFFSILKNTFVVLIVLFAFTMMVFTIISTTSIGSRNRSLFGYKAFIVLTDSMSATDFKAGDLVIVKEELPKNLKVGDIISYRLQNAEQFNEVVTHKIRKIEKGSFGLSFTTYGTTTGIDDRELVSEENVLGRYMFNIPKLGTVFQFLKTVPGYVICILTPFLLIVIIQAFTAIRLFNRYKRETIEEVNEERKKYEQERMENAIIREKLEAAEAVSLKMQEELEELKMIVKKSSPKKKKKTTRKSKKAETSKEEKPTKVKKEKVATSKVKKTKEESPKKTTRAKKVKEETPKVKKTEVKKKASTKVKATKAEAKKEKKVKVKETKAPKTMAKAKKEEAPKKSAAKTKIAKTATKKVTKNTKVSERKKK